MFTSSVDDSDEDAGDDFEKGGSFDMLDAVSLSLVYGGNGSLKLECGDTATADDGLSKSSIAKSMV